MEASDIRPMVEKYSALPFERLRVVQKVDDLRLAGIRAGVIFVYAEWSGPAMKAFGKVMRLLSTLDLGAIDVVILNIDCMTADDTIRLFGHVFGGWGETLWIRNGRVVAELPGPLTAAESLVLSRTQELVDGRSSG